MILALYCQHFQHSYHQDQDAQQLLYLPVPALLEPWRLWETTAGTHPVDGLTIFADHMTHQKHILYVPRNAPTMDSRRGITVQAAAVAEVVADTLLMEMALRGVRGAGHQDGRPTTIQTDFSEEDPRTTWRRPSGRWARQ